MTYPAEEIALLTASVQGAIDANDVEQIFAIFNDPRNVILLKKYFQERDRVGRVLNVWRELIPATANYTDDELLSIFDAGLTSEQIKERLHGLGITSPIDDVYQSWLAEQQ